MSNILALGHRLSVTLRMALGFTLLLGMLGLVAMQGYGGVTAVGARGEDVATAGDLAIRIGEANARMGDAQVAIRDYLLTSDQTFFDRTIAAVTEGRRILGAARELAVGEQAQAILRLDGRLAEWGGRAQRVRAAWLAYIEEVEQKLFPLGVQLSEQSLAVVTAVPDLAAVHRVMAETANARAAVNRFMHRGEERTVSVGQERLAQARASALAAAQLPGLPDAARPQLLAIAQGLERFAGLYREVVRLRAEIDRERDQSLRALGADIAREASSVLATTVEAAARSRAEGSAVVGATGEGLLLFGVGSLVLGLLLAFLLARSVTAPLGRVSAAVTRIAAGQTTEPVPDQHRGDELGAVARALEGLRAMVGQAFAREQMVEQLPIGVMMADPRDNFRVTYMNPKSIELLRPMEHLMPVTTEALIGQSVDILHRNPGHQRAILSDPSRLPHRARIRLGQESLDLNISAVRDRDGNYSGAMLCWSVATRQAQLADRFEADVGAVIEGLAATTAQVEQAVASLDQAARGSGERAGEVAHSGREAGADVQSVAASAEELASSVAEITRQVAEGAQVARAAAEEARATNATVEGLAQAAQRINDVVRLIGDIAGQTNLLALNATIEAARAGEAGKGFAVVASEVKALANQTGRATEEIGAQITAVQKAADGAVAALRSIGGTVGRMEEVTSAIAAAVEEQGAATREIARSAARVAGSTEQVVNRIEDVRHGTEETGRAAVGLSAAVKEMAGQTGALREKSSSFLAAVRAA